MPTRPQRAALAARQNHARMQRAAGGSAPAAAPAPLYLADFTALTAGAVATLPGSLVLTRASGSATMQTSESTLATGIGVDTARAGRLATTDPMALGIERAATNLLLNSRNPAGAGWLNDGGGTTTTGYAAGPDGTANGARVQCASGGFGARQNLPGVTAGTYSMTVWLRGPAGGEVYNVDAVWGISPVIRTVVNGTLTTAWRRVAVTGTVGGVETAIFFPVDGRGPEVIGVGSAAAGARDNVVDFAQVETGLPSSAIVTAGATATRAGERLYHPTRATLLDGGRLSLEVVCRPRWARAQYPSASYLWYADASNYARVNVDGTVTATVGGAAYATAGAVTWAANDTVKLFVAAGGGSATTVVKAAVNGAVTTLGTSGAPQAAIASAGTLDLLCAGTASQLSAFVERIAAWGASDTPTWAA